MKNHRRLLNQAQVKSLEDISIHILRTTVELKINQNYIAQSHSINELLDLLKEMKRMLIKRRH